MRSASAAAPTLGAAIREGFTGTTKITLADFGILRDLGPASKDVELTLNIEGREAVITT